MPDGAADQRLASRVAVSALARQRLGKHARFNSLALARSGCGACELSAIIDKNPMTQEVVRQPAQRATPLAAAIALDHETLCRPSGPLVVGALLRNPHNSKNDARNYRQTNSDEPEGN